MTKIVEVNIDDPEEEAGQGDGQALQMFQQQRLYHTMRLKREIAKLEKMERDIAQKASEIGPESNRGHTRKSPKQCWGQQTNNHNNNHETKTSFKDIHDRRKARPNR